jgi:hypothetical protein
MTPLQSATIPIGRSVYWLTRSTSPQKKPRKSCRQFSATASTRRLGAGIRRGAWRNRLAFQRRDDRRLLDGILLKAWR